MLAFAALAALVALVALVALSAVPAWAAFGTVPRLDSLICLPVSVLFLSAAPAIVCFRMFLPLNLVAA